MLRRRSGRIGARRANFVAAFEYTRESRDRVGNGEQYLMIAAAAQVHPVSRQWKGYWQRRTA